MKEGFQLTPRIAEVFFRYCHKFNVTEEKARIEVLRRLVAKRKAKYLRDPIAILEGKKVLQIKNRKDNK